MGARTGARELHAERVFAGLQFLSRNEVLLGFDAQEVVDVVQLVLLDKQGVPAKARAVGEDDAGGIRIGDYDVGENLIRAIAHADRQAFGNRHCAGVIDVAVPWRLGRGRWIANMSGPKRSSTGSAKLIRASSPHAFFRASSFSGYCFARSVDSERSTSTW